MTEEEGRLLDFIRQRKQDYQLACNAPAMQRMLADLAVFCRALETCVVPGDRDRTMVLEGRREVWLRIMQHCNLSSQQLFFLYSGKTFNTEGEVLDG
jgi:hypothetical protein